MTQAVVQVRNIVARSGFANPLTLEVLVTDEDYLKVYADTTLLDNGPDYIITGIGDPNGVEIEIIGAEDVDNYVGTIKFVAVYEPPLDQQTDLSAGGVLGRSFESGLDQQNRRLQALGDRVDRALKVDVDVDGDIVIEKRAASAVVWNDDADGFVALPVELTDDGTIAALQGEPGEGVPTGGTAGQILTKQSSTDFDTDWEDLAPALPAGGTDGQVLKKQSATDYDVDWENESGGSGLPYVEDYGAEGDGTTDDAAAFAAGIAAVAALGGGALYCRGKEYAIGSTIVIGDGSAAAYSTINGVRLVGVGAPFQRLDNGGGPLEDNGTRLKWIGAAGGQMMRIAGPSRGNDVQNIAFNGNGLAGGGLEVLSNARGEFIGITGSDMQAAATIIKLGVVSAESIGGQTESIACEGNLFRGTRLTLTAADTTGVNLGGYTGSASNGWDSVRNRFEDTYLLINRDGGVGVLLGFTDQNTFDDFYCTGFGTSDGNEASVKFVSTTTVPGGYVFPQNIRFTGNVDIGQELPVVVTGDIGAGNTFGDITLLDLQEIPRGATAAPLAFGTVETGIFPDGGYIQKFGGLVNLSPENRNLLANSRFERATLGASIVNPTNGATLLDDWFIVFDGSVTCTVSQQTFTPGQDDVPFEPKNFMRIVVSAASGGTYLEIGQSRDKVGTFEGRRTTFSAWLKADASHDVNFLGQQLFGSGGSAQVDTLSTAQSVGTSWERKAYEVSMPSITGKTVGSGDVVIGYIALPVNTAFTIDIALPQWELGRVDTPPERRPNTLDALIRHSPTNLVALADIAAATTGMLAKTGTGAFAARTITAPAAGITVSNGDGVSGNPTLALANDLAALEALGSTGFAARTGSDAWAQRTLTAPSEGLTISNPAGIAGNPTFALADDLAALEALSGTDTIYRRSGTSTWSAVTVAAALSFSSGTLGLNVANANTWTANQTFQTATDSATVATFKSTDAGANAGPYSDWIRDSASPADNDGGGIFRFIMRNSAATLVAFTSVVANIKTVTNGAEAGQFRILNYVAGAQTVVFDVQGGVQLGSPTGADKGVGTINVASRGYVNGNEIPYRLQGTATYDPASLADAAGATTTVTVTGAALGDIAAASFSNALQGITLTAWVSATDTVSVRFQNESGGTLDLASGTLKAWVFK